jgi:hypothetical protein
MAGQISRVLDLSSVTYSTGASVASEVDTANCDGVLFVGVPASTASRTWSMALKYGATTAAFVNCASTHTLTSTGVRNDILVTDVYKPAARYLGATLSSTTATPAYVLAFKYGVRKMVGNFSSTSSVPIAAGGVKRVVSPTSST